MKTAKNMLVMLLVALLVTPTLVACGNTVDETTQTKTTGENVETETETETELTDSVPELDFDGASFRSIGQESALYDLYMEEETGDALNDSIYYRNRDIEERFHVVIEATEAIRYSELSPQVKKTITAGDDAYDLVLGQMEQSGYDAQGGIYQNWYDIPYVDFTMPWWPKSIAQNAATVNGKMYTTVSDLCISYAEQTWSIVYDKTEADNYGIEDIYTLVVNGEWTIDKMLEITESVYTDTNGNGERDADDYYGYVSALNGCLLLSYFYGFDQRLAVVDGEKITMTLNTEKAAAICDTLHYLHYQSEGTYMPSGSSNSDIYAPFINGNSMFNPMQLSGTYKNLREYENEYSIIPMPKWDEEQAEYYSTCDAGCNIMAIPVTATQLEMIGAVVEALSAYSYKTVLPTYYNIALGAKAARNPESVEMINLVLSSRAIDFAYLYDGWNGWVFKLADFVKTEGAFASTYEKNEKAMQTYYDKVLAFFYEE